jgi:tetrahydromethanopterin S-methyltransferase subunit C
VAVEAAVLVHTVVETVIRFHKAIMVDLEVLEVLLEEVLQEMVEQQLIHQQTVTLAPQEQQELAVAVEEAEARLVITGTQTSQMLMELVEQTEWAVVEE